MPNKLPVPENKRFGRLVVVADGGRNSNGSCRWHVRCDCGVEKCVDGYHVRAGNIRSCGCLNRELTAERNRTHGYCTIAPLAYASWKGMLSRCLDPQNPAYKHYGGRGIVICKAWKDFLAFYGDMGERAPSLSLDRIDGDKGYEPSNCRWSTLQEQNQNRKNTQYLTIDGETHPRIVWLRRYGLGTSTFRQRIARGLSPKEALTRMKNIRPRNYKSRAKTGSDAPLIQRAATAL